MIVMPPNAPWIQDTTTSVAEQVTATDPIMVKVCFFFAYGLSVVSVVKVELSLTMN